MKKELEEKLVKRFKFLQRKNDDGTPYSMFGIECSDGWFDLLWRLFEEIKKKLEKGNSFSVSQIKEKWGCYDKDTEVLTKNGWKYFKDIVGEDEIATLSKSGYLEYQKPTDIIFYKYNGKMYRLKTRGVDLVVTPNHNLYVGKGSYYNGQKKPIIKVIRPFELTTYEKYYKKNKCFKKSSNWIGENVNNFIIPRFFKEWDRGNKYGKTRKKYGKKNVDMKFWLKFLGWYIAEGCVGTKRNGEISIDFNNTDGGREKNRIENIIKKCKIKYNVSMLNRPAGVFKIYTSQIGVWLKENCGKDSATKKVPDFIKQLNPKLIKIFLKELYLGDGHKSCTSEILYTISKKLSDDVQELILKAGDTSKIRCISIESLNNRANKIIDGKRIYSRHCCYCVNWLKKSNIYNTANKGMSPSSAEELINYNDFVYCVSVPNKIIYVRRNGIPVWCGNSLRLYVCGATDEIYKLINKAEIESGHICEDCGKKGKLINYNGWLRTQCKKCLKEWKEEYK